MEEKLENDEFCPEEPLEKTKGDPIPIIFERIPTEVEITELGGKTYHFPKIHWAISGGPVSSAKEDLFTYPYRPLYTSFLSLYIEFKLGYSFIPAKLKENCFRRLNKNFERSNIIISDVDYGLSLSEAETLVENQAIAYYTTKSHQVLKEGKINDRYRLIFILPYYVGPTMYRILQVGLQKSYYHDPNISDPARGYLTNPKTIRGLAACNNRLDVPALIIPLLQEKSFETIVKKSIREFEDFNTPEEFYLYLKEVWGVEYIPRGYRKLDNSNYSSTFANSYNNIIDIGKSRPIFTAPEPDKVSYSRSGVRNFDLDYVRSKCQLLNEIELSNHSEMFHCATNFAQIEGGKKLFLELVSGRPYGLEKGLDYYDRTFDYIRQKEYKPSFCSTYCRFHNKTCFNEGNLITLEKERRRKIVQVEKNTPIKIIEEARVELKEVWDKIQSELSAKKYLLLAPTGSGKSFLLESLKETDGRILIVGPTYQQLSTLNIGVLYPEIPELILEKIQKFNREAKSNKRLLNSPDFRKYLYDDELLIVDKYLKEVKQAEEAKILRITHSRLLLDQSIIESGNIDCIYIDEDIFKSVYQISSIPISIVQKYKDRISKFVADYDSYSPYHIDFFDQFLKDTYGKITKTEDHGINFFDKDSGLLLQKVISSISSEYNCHPTYKEHIGYANSIRDLISSSYFIKGNEYIDFIKKNELPEGIKTVILSATASAVDYKREFGDDLEIYSIENIAPRGKLLQFNSSSFSKTSMKKDEKKKLKFSEITKTLKEQGYSIISHKSLMRELDSKHHIQATEGIREYEGKNLIILGTPFPTESYIKLNAAIRNFDLNNFIPYIKNNDIYVEYNGFKFKIRTLSNDPNIINLQLDYINSILTQSVGRARYFENDKNVILFSNFPLRNFEQNDSRKIDDILNKISEL